MNCDELIDQDKINHFYLRTFRHRKLVEKYGNILKKFSTNQNTFTQRILMHDYSKYSTSEFKPYILLSWKYHLKNAYGKDIEYPESIVNEIKEASLHHIKTNTHHPEFYNNVNQMKQDDLVEMVSDWAAMSEELNNSLKEFADKNIGSKWEFNDEKKSIIYGLINVVENYKEE